MLRRIILCKLRRKNKYWCSLFHNSCKTDADVKLEVTEHDTVNKPSKTKPQSAASVLIRGSDKPNTNFPIAKNFYLGKFDTEALVYPEFAKSEDLEHLKQLVQPVEKFFQEGIDSKSIDINAKIPDDTLQQLKDLGLFGQQIPTEYGGLGLNATEYARIAEATALDGAIAVTLAAHQAIGLKGILIAGNEEQKKKYLPDLASGDHIAAFCLTESTSGSDAASIQSKAILSEDGKHYLLTGNKIWISNGGIADIFTVFAKTPYEDDVTGKIKQKVTAFIVERAFGGVTSGKPEDKLGIRGSNTCEVHFDNTPVPVENVLGEVGHGFKVAMNILNSGRFSMGSAVAGSLKRLISDVTEHAITRTQFTKKLSEFQMIQEKLAKMAIRTYAMESMAYYTAGILDGYEEPDASTEAAMVKVYSSEGAWWCINEGLQILGGLGYMKDYPYERYLRDARILLIFEGTNEILRLFIALNGCQHAGVELSDIVRKMRDPLNNMSFVVKQLPQVLPGFRKKNKKKYMLENHVHQNLGECATRLEHFLNEFKAQVQHCLSVHAKDIIEQQLLLKRMADVTIDLYAMTATLSRASRSLCIGLRNADHEVALTQAFFNEAVTRLETNIKELRYGVNCNGDELLNNIAKTIIKSHGYAAEHPLERNW